MVRLTVTLIQGRNLIAADLNGKSDPYCVLQLRSGGPKFTSKVVPKSLSPIWNEVFHFNVVGPDILDISCFDQDMLGKSDPLGRVSIALQNLPHGVVSSNWYKLEGVPSGEIELSIWFSNEATPNKYKIHHNTFAGTMVNGTPGEKYPTYEVDLFHVATYFGNQTQHWNEKYDNAIAIFGPGPKATCVRGVIHAQHAGLYRDGLFRTDVGTLETADDFLNLIAYGVRNNQRRFFTYVIMEDVMRFSETGAAFFKDFMSKHATHADAARDVRYSGEFHIQEYQGAHRLVIDNNSGTYSPNPALLPNLAALLVANFPGLVVETVHYEDPRLAAYKKQVDEENAARRV